MTGKSTRPIVVVGSINVDLVSNAERIPSAGETILGSHFEIHPGGKGANQAVAAARLGCPVRMIGRVGTDVFGRQSRATLAESGVDLAGVADADGSTGTASIVVAASGENSIVVTPAANAALTPQYLETQLSTLRGAAIVLTQLEIPIETVEYLAALCEREQVPLVLDPAPAHKLSQKLLKRVRWFTPNETEAGFYDAQATRANRNDDPAALARRLRNIGPSGVILKLGARGAYLMTDSEDGHIPAPVVDVMDTTAAGDTFNGAFAAALVLGKPAWESAAIATAAASISVTRAGAQPSMPTLEEVMRALDQG